MKFENTQIYNFDAALRGMRNPKNSWEKTDSKMTLIDPEIGKFKVEIGPNDMKLAQMLISGGPVHSKFLRQIFVSVDITAPIEWWVEMDTYKVGTTANSCSTMHKMHDHALTIDDFQGDIEEDTTDDESKKLFKDAMDMIIKSMNILREKYLETKNYEYIRRMKKLLPGSFLQKRTWTANYEVLRNIYTWRRAHRLPEWRIEFVNWLKELPYFEEFIMYRNIRD